MNRRLLAGLLVLALFVPLTADAVGNCAILRSWVTGDVVTASDLTQSFVTVGQTNLVPTCVDDYSADTTQMQAVTDPYPSSVVSLSTSLAGELERLRYVIKKLTGWSQWYAHTEAVTALAALPRSFLAGLKLSNNATDATNDIDIAVGAARDGANEENLVLGTAITKRLDAAWTVGTNQGGLDTGAIANGTYHVYLIKRVDTGVVDVLFSTSGTAPTMPANYTKKRRIGSIMRESAAIVAFTQDGDHFYRVAPVLSVDATNPTTSAVLRTLGVPLGERVRAIVNVSVDGGATTSPIVYLSDPRVNDDAPSASAAPLGGVRTTTGINAAMMVGPVWVRTDTAARIRTRASASDANTILRIATLGWIDRRGQDD